MTPHATKRAARQAAHDTNPKGITNMTTTQQGTRLADELQGRHAQDRRGAARMNAARVDVLALMDRNAVQATDTRIALEWSPQWLKESAEQDAVARAAVAELIEASRHGSVILRALGGPTVAERDAAVARIAAALAACGVAS